MHPREVKRVPKVTQQFLAEAAKTSGAPHLSRSVPQLSHAISLWTTALFSPGLCGWGSWVLLCIMWVLLCPVSGGGPLYPTPLPLPHCLGGLGQCVPQRLSGHHQLLERNNQEAWLIWHRIRLACCPIVINVLPFML